MSDRLSLDAIGGGFEAVWAVGLGNGKIEMGPTLGLIRIVESSRRGETRIASQVGQARFGAVIRWSMRARGATLTVALDGDGSLGDVIPDDDGDGFDPQLPPPLQWSVGLLVGVGFEGVL